MSEHNVLVYVRPWNFDQFKDLANRIWPDSGHIYISEHKSCDKSGYFDLFYENFKLDEDVVQSKFDKNEIDEIIKRCRLLRSLDYEIANKLIFSCERAIRHVIEINKPANVLSITIDSYILDVMERICIEIGIKFVGLVPVFLNGYFRVTSRGERNTVRDVHFDEVASIKGRLLADDYKPSFLKDDRSNSRFLQLKSYAVAVLRPFAYFVARHLKGDPANYHLWSSEVVWREKRAWLENPTYVEFDEILKNSSSTQPTLFLPLQMSPEATIDYWSTDMKWIDYEDFVCDLVDKISPNFRIVVKEHPNVVGFRTAGFYKRLAAIPGCSMVHHKVNSNQILKACDGVVVCTGSVGFEAFLRGKPVFTSSEIFYDEKNYAHGLEELIKSGLMSAASDDSVRTGAVEGLLKCVAPGKFINDGTWSAVIPEHLQENAKVAKAITLFLEESVMQK